MQYVEKIEPQVSRRLHLKIMAIPDMEFPAQNTKIEMLIFFSNFQFFKTFLISCENISVMSFIQDFRKGQVSVIGRFLNKGALDLETCVEYFAFPGRCCIFPAYILNEILLKAIQLRRENKNSNFHNFFLEVENTSYIFLNLRHLYQTPSKIF